MSGHSCVPTLYTCSRCCQYSTLSSSIGREPCDNGLQDSDGFFISPTKLWLGLLAADASLQARPSLQLRSPVTPCPRCNLPQASGAVGCGPEVASFHFLSPADVAEVIGTAIALQLLFGLPASASPHQVLIHLAIQAFVGARGVPVCARAGAQTSHLPSETPFFTATMSSTQAMSRTLF